MVEASSRADFPNFGGKRACISAGHARAGIHSDQSIAGREQGEEIDPAKPWLSLLCNFIHSKADKIDTT